MIKDYGQKNFGLSLSEQEAQNIMNNSGGGDPGRLDAAFNALPQVQTDTAFKNAARAQAMQVEANKPAVARLESHKTNLDQKYDELLQSIGQSEAYSQDQGNIEARQALAARGINPGDELGAKIIGDKLRPISTQFGQLKANTGLSREQDQSGIEQQIAALLAGNVPNSLNFSTGVMGLQQQAQQIANNLELGRESNSISRMNAETAAKGNAANPYDRYTTIGEGQTLWDLLNNVPLYTAAKTYKPSSGGGGGSYNPGGV